MDKAEVKEDATLITELAKAGAMAYPPGAAVLDTLTQIGGAFLESNHDDLLFQFEMMLDGEGGEAVLHAPMAVGLYAFVRQQDRSKPVD